MCLGGIKGKLPTSVEGAVRDFIEQQHVFFVATAPLAADAHVNLSPKGADTFRVLGPTTVAYLDLTGSGVETIAHLRENRRIVIMFCAFQGPPKILRLHGVGRVVEPRDGEFASAWAAKKGIEGLKQYRRDKNRVSMDGLPGAEEF